MSRNSGNEDLLFQLTTSDFYFYFSRHNVEACDIFRYFLHIFESADSAEEATVGSCYELLKNLHGKLVKLLGNVAFLSPMESGQDEALLARHSLLASLEQVFTF